MLASGPLTQSPARAGRETVQLLLSLFLSEPPLEGAAHSGGGFSSLLILEYALTELPRHVSYFITGPTKLKNQGLP